MTPDGSTIIYRCLSGPFLRPGVASDIYSIAQGQTQPTQLTHGPLINSWPWVSPDGRSIVYISTSWSDAGSHVCVMDMQGRNSHQLTFGNCADSAPSYSRDGNKIIFMRAARHRPYSMGGMIWDDWDVWDMNTDGSSLRQLTFSRFYGIDPPYFSPNGKHILFAATFNDGRSPKLLNCLLTCDILDNGAATKPNVVPIPLFTKDWAYDSQPSYSPDGSTIAFCSRRSRRPFYGYEIWTTGIDGTNLRQITHAGSLIEHPIFSPDGNFIYYWEPMGGLWRRDADGSNPKELVP